MAVLAGLGTILAVRRRLVCLVVDFGAECVGELLCGTDALLTKIVTFSEVLAQVLVITVKARFRRTKLNLQDFSHKNKSLQILHTSTPGGLCAITPIIFLRAVSVAEVAEVVVLSQVFEQLVVVEVAVVAEFTQRVSPVTGVIWVAVSSMACEFFTVVPLPLMGKDLGEESIGLIDSIGC